jgi:hypothetical protein
LTFLLHYICGERGEIWIRQQAVCLVSRGRRNLTLKEGYYCHKNILSSLEAVSFLLTFWEKSHVRLIDPLHLIQTPQIFYGIGKIVPVPKHHSMKAYMRHVGKIPCIVDLAVEGGELSALYC